MSYSSDYIFNDLTRVGDDNCTIDQNSIQNVNTCNYLLQNYYTKDCSMKDTKALATSQPCINYKGSYGMGAGGCNVDDNSKLLLGGLNTHPRCRIDLFQRPFVTVPYLGRGSVDPIVESQIMQGDSITNRRSITHVTEKSFLKYHNTPLIPEVKDSIQNPQYLVEGVASKGWVRGGVPSRELTKDQNYYKQRTDFQYV
jgi:hypothetical protein